MFSNTSFWLESNEMNKMGRFFDKKKELEKKREKT